jgi:hypothetical protein
MMPARAEIVLELRPPVTIHEERVARPSPRHVWIAGYHRWDGGAYVWERGRWEVPPREHAVWVAPRWRHRNDGRVRVRRGPLEVADSSRRGSRRDALLLRPFAPD